MSVGRRLMASLVALIVCAGLLGGAALLGLLSLSGHFRESEDRHRELRAVFEVGHRAATMQMLLGAEEFDGDAFARHLHRSLVEAERLNSGAAGARSISGLLRSIESGVRDRERDVRTLPALHGVLSEVAATASKMEAAIIENRQLASSRLRLTIGAMGALFALCGSVAVAVGVAQYRAVMRPIRALDSAAAELAAERFARVGESGDLEFRRLMRQFNRMSDSLEQLHHSMQSQVEIKTRLWMRSEQLASVGRLAAGLAHEINNPLAIMAGHAEASLRTIRRGDAKALADAERALGIVRDEAFRCGAITRGLLDMSRGSDTEMESFPIRGVMERAVDLVRGLPVAHGQSVRINDGAVECDLSCIGRPADILQAALNLLTNALEACEPGAGRVEVSIGRSGDRVEVRIADNGCGMSAETLAAAFDPFFTDKRRKASGGVGLGLAITHAIVERSGGRLEAWSDGPGRGSAFALFLPRHCDVSSEKAWATA